LVHGVAIAGVQEIATEAKKPMAAPTRHGRNMVSSLICFFLKGMHTLADPHNRPMTSR
jgi:hypothetical protein